jgi:glycine cleavage system H protein
MTTILGCKIPEDLHYLVEKHVWARREEDGLVVIGLTDVAQHLAKGIISVTTKRVGRSLVKGKSVATVESSKWVGPVPVPVGGELVEVNQALSSDPTLLNRDPYGDGWIAKLRADDWEGESKDLVSGPEGVAAYQSFLEREGISCEER